MKGLFIKDIRILSKQKNFLLMIIIVSIIFGFIFDNMNFMNSYLAFFSTIYILGTLNYDEFDNGMAYLMALPSSRKDYILSKYLLMVTTICTMSFLGIIINLIYAFIKGIPLNLLEMIITIIVSNLLALFVMDIMLPIQLKYGNEKSRVAIVIIYGLIFLFGFLIFNFINSYSPQMLQNILFLIKQNPMIIVGIGLLLIILLSLISFKLSNMILAKKEF